LTTGNLPNVLESTSFTGQSSFFGGVSFLDQDVVLGTRGGAAAGTGAERGGATLELNAVLQGASPLHFEGLSADKRTVSMSVEEPSGRNTITLPDVSGTIITTGNFPDVVERLRILGDATFEGTTYSPLRFQPTATRNYFYIPVLENSLHTRSTYYSRCLFYLIRPQVSRVCFKCCLALVSSMALL
jgi:hypothetical protein